MPNIEDLLAGQLITINGQKYRKVDKPLTTGQMYIAQRNTGPHVLFVGNVKVGAVYPTDLTAYAYDLDECVPVEEVYP